MALIDRIARFTTGTYNVSRPSMSYVVGRAVAAASTAFTVVASVQPLGGADLKVLPEGAHVADSRKVITVYSLRTRDLVTIDGEVWAIYHIDGPWIFRGGSHYNAFAARQVIP